MPHYFFHIRAKGELIEDVDGVELPDATSLRRTCAMALREIAAEEERWETLSPDAEFIIVDEFGNTVATVPIRP